MAAGIFCVAAAAAAKAAMPVMCDDCDVIDDDSLGAVLMRWAVDSDFASAERMFNTGLCEII